MTESRQDYFENYSEEVTCNKNPKECWRPRCNETNRCVEKFGAYTESEKEKVLDEILEALSAEDRRHARKMRMIKIQGYFMEALIIGVFLFFTFAPLFILVKK